MNKEEIIDKIVEMASEIKKLKEELNKQEEPKSCMVDDIRDMIEDFPSSNQWILCSERLPELSDRFRDNFYLVKLYGVFNDLVEVGYAHFVNRPERTWEIMSEHSDKYWRIIAWQPLPEPYKESEEND